MTDTSFLPMLAKELDRHPDTDKPILPLGEDWRMEPKLDGWRFLAHYHHHGTVDWYAGRKGATRQSRSLDELGEQLRGPEDTILDGEIIVAEVGASSGDVSTALATGAPVDYWVFDVIRLGGVDVRHMPYRQRRQLIEMMEFDGVRIKLTPSVAPDSMVYDAWVTNGPLEGVMLKHLDGRYESGKRSRRMLKGKPQETLEGRIVGFGEGQNGRTGTIGNIQVEIIDGNYVEQYGAGYKTTVACYPWLSDQILQGERFCAKGSGKMADYMGRVIEFRVSMILRGGGCRHPVFKCFREDRD